MIAFLFGATCGLCFISGFYVSKALHIREIRKSHRRLNGRLLDIGVALRRRP